MSVFSQNSERVRERECKRKTLVPLQKSEKKRQSESLHSRFLLWRPPRRTEKRGKRKDAFASSSRKKKTKKCAHLLLLLSRRHRLHHHRRRLFILLPFTPRAPPSRLKHPRVLSLSLSLSFLSRARLSSLSLSLSRSEKKKKPSSLGRRDEIRNEETSVVEMHARSSFLPAWCDRIKTGRERE